MKVCKTCGIEVSKNCKGEFCNKHRDRSGKNNPMYGKSVFQGWVEKYGEEEATTRQKKSNEKNKLSMKVKWGDDQYRNKIKETTTGLKRSMEFRVNQQKAAKKQFLDINQRIIRSKIMSESWILGKITDDNGSLKNSYGDRGYINNIFYSSSGEKKRIEFLNSRNIKWKRYTVKDFNFRIFYIHNEKQHLYLPDFIIYKENEIILEELKKNKNNLSEVEQIKAKAAKKICEENNLTYRVIDFSEVYSIL